MLESAVSADEEIAQDLASSPYLLVQRAFEEEDPDTELCYVETHDPDYQGHFRLRLKEFSPTRLAFEIARAAKNYVDVLFSLSAPEFQEARRIVNVIFGN